MSWHLKILDVNYENARQWVLSNNTNFPLTIVIISTIQRQRISFNEVDCCPIFWTKRYNITLYRMVTAQTIVSIDRGNLSPAERKYLLFTKINFLKNRIIGNDSSKIREALQCKQYDLICEQLTLYVWKIPVIYIR